MSTTSADFRFWEFEAAEPELVGHPEPEVWARTAGESEIPGGAKRLLVAARQGGPWFTWATYAKGTTPSGRLVESVLVKGVGVGRGRWVASYEDGKAKVAYWSPGRGEPPERISFADLRRKILGSEEGS